MFPLMTHKKHHNAWDSFGRAISPSQRAIPGNMQHSPETDKYGLVGFEPLVPENELPQNQDLDHMVFDTG
jgi:hypothetical protein